MATIRKTKHNTWLAEVRKSGRYKSKTFDSKIQAQCWAFEMEQTLVSYTTVLGKTAGDAFLPYQKEISPTKNTRHNEYNRLNKFMRHEIASMLPEDLRQTDSIRGWKRSSIA
jgi:hypothetical protein